MWAGWLIKKSIPAQEFSIKIISTVIAKPYHKEPCLWIMQAIPFVYLTQKSICIAPRRDFEIVF